MAALKEIKSRIASVNNTLKITSAMKMVASAKLHRTQGAAAALTDYSGRLEAMVGALTAGGRVSASSPLLAESASRRHATLVVVASDSSLCGAFNANLLREMSRQIKALKEEGFGRMTIYAVGEKVVQAALKTGIECIADFRHAASAGYGAAAALADRMMEQYTSGATDRVAVVYSHYRSMSHQEPRIEQLLPMTVHAAATPTTAEYILEPAAPELLRSLLPYALRTHLYEILLDSATAEHAARTVAMQTATDNAQDLLEELTLTYNKRRQQAITDELADITQAG